jgi:hypothetical protein
LLHLALDTVLQGVADAEHRICRKAPAGGACPNLFAAHLRPQIG